MRLAYVAFSDVVAIEIWCLGFIEVPEGFDEPEGELGSRFQPGAAPATVAELNGVERPLGDGPGRWRAVP